jgi:hypothetical protein
MRLGSKPKGLLWPICLVVAWLALFAATPVFADTTNANSAASLQARYASLRDQLSHNQFQRPIYLDSSEGSGDLKGDIYALIDYPFATVDAALKEANPWCDVLILHVNIKYCRVSQGKSGSVLTAYIGRKYDEPLASAHRVDFVHRIGARNPDYLQVLLSADSGPFSTKNYRIMFEAIPLQPGQTFVHLTYSYTYGMMAKLAMQAYLSTVGSDKVGFTVLNKTAEGKAVHVRGVRGVVERNTMRYYLAIDAYLGASAMPPAQQLEKRLRDWFALTELYPLQLHELEQKEYFAMKQSEYRRQQASR